MKQQHIVIHDKNSFLLTGSMGKAKSEKCWMAASELKKKLYWLENYVM